jgi:hypothetical protein
VYTNVFALGTYPADVAAAERLLYDNDQRLRGQRQDLARQCLAALLRAPTDGWRVDGGIAMGIRVVR